MWTKILAKLEKWIGIYSGSNKAKTDIHIKQALYATVILACTKCGAAGVDSLGRDVGKICPVCGGTRPTNEIKGQIWRKLKNAN